VEEAEIADLHRLHVVARGIVAHTVPLRAGLALLLQVVEGELEGFRLEQPVVHGALLKAIPGKVDTGLSSGMAITITEGFDELAGQWKTQFQPLILTVMKRPALASGSPAPLFDAS